jgi:hypothetical protein
LESQGYTLSIYVFMAVLALAGLAVALRIFAEVLRKP